MLSPEIPADRQSDEEAETKAAPEGDLNGCPKVGLVLFGMEVVIAHQQDSTAYANRVNNCDKIKERGTGSEPPVAPFGTQSPSVLGDKDGPSVTLSGSIVQLDRSRHDGTNLPRLH